MSVPEPIIDETDDVAASSSSKSSRFRIGIAISVLAHIVLVIVLVFKYIPSRSGNRGNTSVSQSEPTQSRPEPPKPATSGSISPDQIQKSLDVQIEQIEKVSDEKKLSELERNLRRLESVASTDSVVETGTAVASKLGLNTSQYLANKPPQSGEFDPDTAQLADVTRSKNDAGQWEYESVLVDSGGRQMTVAMNASEGETVFQTFQTMKRYPMAQGIYRGVVMPLLQKMMKAKDAASKIELPELEGDGD